RGEKVVAMVLKELPGKKASSEGNSLLTVTTKLVGEQQESRPLLSPSIDDFLSESRSDAPSARPLTSNTSVLSTALDLVDLSEPGRSSKSRRRMSPLRRSPRRRARPEETELIQVEAEHRPASPRTPERASLDSVSLSSPLDKWDEVKLEVEGGGEFWDKMQAEWEELARRNWLEESEGQRPIPPPVSPVEKSYFFNTNNPYSERPNVFAQGQEKARDGDLNAAVLLLEAAILQDPQDSEAWQLLGMTQAENENEQAAIASLQRCLELRPNNLPALMALAVSFTNSGLQREACDALRRWIVHNPRYKHLVLDHRSPSELQDVLLLFQDAVLLNLDSVDPDLQTGLGVLFNLSSDFNRAVEAFTAALSVRPKDYLLWNRLGATLANGSRSEEAVEAYTRALGLQPGFIRSRYNLGISCINLGAHREAVNNFLTALNQQRRSQRCSHQQMSASIWAALRIAISLMDRPELFQAASVGDLDLLTRAFDVGDF
uniref:PEX5-related protein-like n=1 Tax=Scophthalmus maximus TaxID=52904 RepID=A0A8D3DQ18_SCOMX